MNDSFTFLKESLNKLNKLQSTGPAPVFYPKNNGNAKAAPVRDHVGEVDKKA